MKIEVVKIHAFSNNKSGGNPAGVVLDPKELDEQQMMEISKQLKVSETAFVYPSSKADYKVRFFSPTTEVELCGHATIAAFSLIGNSMEKPDQKIISLSQETIAGVFDINLFFDDSNSFNYAMMQQKNPLLEDIDYDIEELAGVLNINSEDISCDLPKKKVSTGLFTLPICVSSFDVLKKMKPNFKKVGEFCTSLMVGSFHVFTFDTFEKESLYHARNFAPLYGVNEDPVTGTANGAVSGFLKAIGRVETGFVQCEQGDIIGKPGRVRVEFVNDHVWVGGKATIVDTIVLDV